IPPFRYDHKDLRGAPLPNHAPTAPPPRYDHDGQYRPPHEHPTAGDIAAGRTLKGSVDPAVKLSQGAPRWFWWLQEHGAQRRGQRQSAESREQHRDSDGKSELLVHASGKAA